VQDAILEADREKFPRKVRKAEGKISERIKQIGQSSGGRHEKDAMDHSLSLLKALKDERLAG
jgi:hypothetical protein